jgi:drug/metabolite transporter (DMT)-like permease
LRKQNQLGAILAITSTVIWSGNFIVSRYAIHLAGPISLAFFRWTIASISMLPFAYVAIKKEWPIFKQNKLYFFLMGLIGIAIYNTLIYTAGHHTTAINMALFGSTVHPVVSALLGAALIHEKLHWKNITGMALSIFGTIYLLTKGDLINILQFKIGLGDLLMIIAGCCFGTYNVFVRKKPSGISNTSFLFCIFTLGSIFLFPAALFEMKYIQPVAFSTQLLWIVLYIGIGNSTISYLVWNMAIQKIGPGKAALFATLAPLLSSYEAVFFLGETFNKAQITSGLIIIVGIIINTWPTSNRTIVEPTASK